MVTSADVARHAGLSRATVSQVLNGHADRFAPETAERVQRAAEELSYEPSAAGRMLRRGSSDFVIALIPNTTYGGNLQDIFEEVTNQLADNGLTMVLRLSTASSAAFTRMLAGMHPRAVLSLQPFTDEERTALASRGIPHFDTSTSVELNHAIGHIQATHLVDRGYRHIAFAHLQDARMDPYGDEREEAVAEVCAAAGLPAPTVLRLGIDRDEASRTLRGLGPGYGIACYNDDIAIALLFAAAGLGWHSPADIGLIGMDHTPLSRATSPTLTSVGYDLASVAQNNLAAVLGILGREDAPAFTDIQLQVFPGEST